jgi:dTDP-4-dehydrorhamnose reductase
MKILLIGCNGLLGQNLLRTLPKGWRAVGTARNADPLLPDRLAGFRRLDITRADDVAEAVRAERPDRIVNAAALTDVDLCERDPDLCDRINRGAVGNMAATGVPVAHFSTDYVFDGSAGPYREEDATGPLNQYGKAKLASEGLALSTPQGLVLRTMTLWGRGQGMKTSFVDFVKNSLEAKKPIRIVTDQWGNPTLAEDLALATWKLLQAGKSGLYHAAGSEWNSRHAWAAAIAAFYGLDAGLIQPILTSDLKQTAKRPLKSGLLIDKLARDGGFRPRDVAGQLRRVEEADYG